MSTNAVPNAFTSAARGAANRDVGAKGANQFKSTQNLLLDAFLGLKRTSTPEFVKETMDELVRQITHLPHDERGLWVADIFRLWVHKRHPRTGEKEKMLGRQMFLSLYDHFPEIKKQVTDAVQDFSKTFCACLIGQVRNSQITQKQEEEA